MRRLSGANNGGVFTFAEGFHAHLSLVLRLALTSSCLSSQARRVKSCGARERTPCGTPSPFAREPTCSSLTWRFPSLAWYASCGASDHQLVF